MKKKRVRFRLFVLSYLFVSGNYPVNDLVTEPLCNSVFPRAFFRITKANNFHKYTHYKQITYFLYNFVFARFSTVFPRDPTSRC